MTVELILGRAEELAPKVQGPIHCIITDPPYGIAHVSEFAKTPKGQRYARPIENDGDIETAIGLFNKVMDPLVNETAEEAEMYVFTSWKVLDRWRDVVNALGPFEVENVLVWEKGWPGLGDLAHNWAYSYELIIYAKKGMRRIKNRRSSVIAVDRPAPKLIIHPMEKPAELIQILLEQSTAPGDLVVDPFAGSASTLVACQRMGRNGIGFEVDPKYHRDATARLSQVSLF